MPAPESQSTPEPVPTAEPAGTDAEPDTGAAAAEKDQAGRDAPSPEYADFEPGSTPG